MTELLYFTWLNRIGMFSVQGPMCETMVMLNILTSFLYGIYMLEGIIHYSVKMQNCLVNQN